MRLPQLLLFQPTRSGATDYALSAAFIIVTTWRRLASDVYNNEQALRGEAVWASAAVGQNAILGGAIKNDIFDRYRSATHKPVMQEADRGRPIPRHRQDHARRLRPARLPRRQIGKIGSRGLLLLRLDTIVSALERIERTPRSVVLFRSVQFDIFATHCLNLFDGLRRSIINRCFGGRHHASI